MEKSPLVKPYLARIVDGYKKIIPLSIRMRITAAVVRVAAPPLMFLLGHKVRTANYVMHLDPRDGWGVFVLVDHHVYGRVAGDPYQVGLWLRSIAASGGCTAVDIGANYGVYTLEACAADKGANLERIIAIEPHPRVFSRLQRSVEESGFGEGVILLNAACMAEHNQDYPFFSNGSIYSMSRIGKAFGESHATPIRVSGVTLDGILSDLGIPKTGKFVIKMDIEGNEPIALRGMKQTLSASQGYQVFFELCPRWLRECGNDPIEFASDVLAMNNDLVAEINEEEGRLVPVEDLEAFVQIINRCSTANDVYWTNILACRNWPCPSETGPGSGS